MASLRTFTSPRTDRSARSRLSTPRPEPGAKPGSLLQRALKRDRLTVGAGLAALTMLVWIHLVRIAADMGMPGSMGEAVAMTRIRPWTGADFALMFWMWLVMMVAMMLPSAAPMILVFARVSRKAREEGHPFAPTGAFTAGYLAAWGAFSLVATGLQWALDQAALLSPMMVATSPALGGTLLIAAGIYQLTPFKDACLKHCRSPIRFITHHWRRGTTGALRMGLEHGFFCICCCWALMGLLFFGGVMNFVWIVGIAVFVLLEKVAPLGAHAGRITGAILALAGVLVVASAV